MQKNYLLNTKYQFFVSFLLTGIIAMIYLVEAGATFNHYFSYEHSHKHHHAANIDHSDCATDCAHFSQKIEKLCEGHFFNFMPQLSAQKMAFTSSEVLQAPSSVMIFSLVKQYSSSYKHLFTSRPPPFLA